ncbi:MAG: GNAT family N-acetyltransferase [Phycisphaerae bacterium]|nr:GNAT family N-acetyltransferase [Phycisphaerae bacterium]
MPAVELLCLTPEIVTELVENRFEAAHPFTLGELHPLVTDVAEHTERFRRAKDAPPAWCGYLAFDAEERFVVGTCAFKGVPDAEGVVEIAYFTFPMYERRGYATAMATELIRRARLEPDVRRMCAHTAPETNASTRLLERLGFVFFGPVDDPEDGPIWRWEQPW